MKIEVTEREVYSVFWSRIATRKRMLLAMIVMFVPALIFIGITEAVSPDLSPWIGIPVAVALIMPGLIAYFRLGYRADKEANRRVAELKASE